MSDIHALSGAYAVDALDDVERAEFERHLAAVRRVPGRGRVVPRDRRPDRRDRGGRRRPASLRDERARRDQPDPAAAPGDSRGPRPSRADRRPRSTVVVGAAAAARWRPRPRSSCSAVGALAWHPWHDDRAPSLADQVLARTGRRAGDREARPAAGELTLVRSASLDRAVLVTTDVPAAAGRQGLPAVAPAAGRGMVSAGLMPDADEPDRAHRRRGHGRRRPRSRVEPDGGSTQPTTDPVALFPFDSARRGTTRHDHRTDRRRRIAVVGSGVAGLTAAYVAARTAHVTLYEADDRLGGHADTHDVDGLAIDTGFIVHNERTYPTLLRLFAELGVATQASEMSMSVRDEETGLEYAGALGARGLFPTARNLARPGVPADAGRGPALPPPRARAAGSRRPTATTARCASSSPRAASRRTSAATSWSRWSRRSGRATRRSRWTTPRATCFEFLAHHGMLVVTGSPAVAHGGRRLAGVRRAGRGRARRRPRRHQGHLRASRRPTASRSPTATARTATYDAVVIATHPDQALAMLAEPTAAQRRGAGGDALLRQPRAAAHRHLAAARRPSAARASWNFLRPRRRRAAQVTVTYDLTRLQRLATDTHYLVTLGGEDLVDPDLGDRPDGVRAPALHPRVGRRPAAPARGEHRPGRLRRRLPRLGLPRGRRALRRCRRRPPRPALGRRPQACRDAGDVRRRRSGTPGASPFRRSFEHRAHTWLVDLDDLPDHGVLGTFEARDHLGSPDRSLRENVDAFLAEHGVDLDRRPRC